MFLRLHANGDALQDRIQDVAAHGPPLRSCRLADQLSLSVGATYQESGAPLFRINCRHEKNLTPDPQVSALGRTQPALRYNAAGGAV